MTTTQYTPLPTNALIFNNRHDARLRAAQLDERLEGYTEHRASQRGDLKWVVRDIVNEVYLSQE